MPLAKQPSITSTRRLSGGRKTFWRALSSALMVAMLLFSSATAGSAAPEEGPGPIDASTIPDVRKPEVAVQIREKVAHDFCLGEVRVNLLPWEVNKDVDPGSAKFKKCYDYALSIVPTRFDDLIPYTTPEGRKASCEDGGPFFIGVGIHDYSKDFGYGTKWCAEAKTDAAGQKMDTAWRDFWSGIIGAGGVATVDFVADPQGSTDKLANSLKTDATSALTQVINDVSRATDFDPDADWFRTQWAAFAGIGVLVLAFMVLRTMRDYGEEKITAEEATHALVGFAPLSLLLVLFGPAIGHFLNTQISTLNTGIIHFTSGSMLGFAKATDFNGIASGGVFGPVAGIIVWGLLLLGAWSILLLFVVQGVALSLIGVGLAIALAFLVHPLWRKRAMTAGITYVGILLSKPLLLLILGFVMAMIGSASPVEGGTDDSLANGLRILTVGVVLLTFGFAPATLFKYMPLLPKGGGSVAHHSSGTGRAVVAGAAGAMMSSRMFSKSSSSRGRQPGGSGAGTGSGGSTRPGGGAGSGSGAGPGRGTSTSSAVGEKASGVPDAGSTAGQVNPASSANTGGGAQKKKAGKSMAGLEAVEKGVGKVAGAGVRAGVPLVAGTAKVAAGVALKSALAAANAAASSGKSQAHDHAPDMD